MATPASFQSAQAATAQGALLLIRRQWDRMRSLDDWPSIASRVTLMTSAGQYAAAVRGGEFVMESLSVDPVAEVNPRAFAGLAPDGRPLESMLYSSVVHAREKFEKVDEQLASGRKWLEMLAHTAIADAGRAATQVQIVATPRAGYVRMVNPPCCQRCAVLAGKWFRWNQGFERHPRCDCVHVPAIGGKPPEGFINDIEPDQIRDLTDAQRRAIADGADANQVMNAYRDRIKNREGLMWTNEGSTRRGWASYVQREIAKQRGELARESVTHVGRRGYIANYAVRSTGPRPTPDAIYSYADRHGMTREETVRVLARTGYFVGDVKDIARLAA